MLNIEWMLKGNEKKNKKKLRKRAVEKRSNTLMSQIWNSSCRTDQTNTWLKDLKEPSLTISAITLTISTSLTINKAYPHCFLPPPHRKPSPSLLISSPTLPFIISSPVQYSPLSRSSTHNSKIRSKSSMASSSLFQIPEQQSCVPRISSLYTKAT